jgi:segregation and condensation protein B
MSEMEKEGRLSGMIESFLFIVGDEGLTPKQLITLTERKESEVIEAIDWLRTNYERRSDSGIELKVFGGAYRLVTKAEFAEDIKRLLENPSPKSMTQASLEVLAIIAYRQPVTRVEIDDLRGVKSEGPINTLIAKGLIMEKGRSEGSGRAILYGTTDLFLDRFGLESLEELPPLSQEEEGEIVETDLFMTKFQEAFAMENDGGGNIS